MEACIEFNNAGVDCMEAGRHKIAWDLFKGALEVKLALEKAEKTGLTVEEAMVQFRNSYIDRAENHFCNISRILNVPAPPDIPDANNHEDRPSSSSTSSIYNLLARQHQEQNAAPPAPSSSSTPVAPRIRPDEPLFYSPYLCTRSLRLDPRENYNGEVPESMSPISRKESATIIFNLALVDHMKNRCSDQSVALYELSMTLLTGDPVDMLGVALVNNIGVWCYENGDADGAKTCMGHLTVFLTSSSARHVSAKDKEGLNANIIWLTQPPALSSAPAA